METVSKLAKVVEFFYRQPDSSIVDLVHKNGALASWQVGSNEEAVAAAKAGCDIIVAQGVEAGGHVRGKIGLLTLLEQVLDSVNVPVLAAGGIGSGRTMAAALAAGRVRGPGRDPVHRCRRVISSFSISESSDLRGAGGHCCYGGLLGKLA